MSEEQFNQVITKKNEGRVAAGKRLAEWNRKNKADLQKNLSKSTAQEGQEPVAGPHKFPDSAYLYVLGGLAAVLAACVAVYYIRKKPAETPEPSVSTGVRAPVLLRSRQAMSAEGRNPSQQHTQKQREERHIDIFKMR